MRDTLIKLKVSYKNFCEQMLNPAIHGNMACGEVLCNIFSVSVNYML